MQLLLKHSGLTTINVVNETKIAQDVGRHVVNETKIAQDVGRHVVNELKSYL
jgi:hypothetical protein